MLQLKLHMVTIVGLVSEDHIIILSLFQQAEFAYHVNLTNDRYTDLCNHCFSAFRAKTKIMWYNHILRKRS